MNAPVQVTRLVLKDGTEITPNLYIQNGRSLYKVGTPEPEGDRPGTTATVCFDNGVPLARTTVRRISAGALAQLWKPADDAIVERYHKFLDGTS